MLTNSIVLTLMNFVISFSCHPRRCIRQYVVLMPLLLNTEGYWKRFDLVRCSFISIRCQPRRCLRRYVVLLSLLQNTENGTSPTDKELLDWADGYLRPHLEPCVKRVIELNTNDNAFREVLDEPFISDNDIVSDVYPLRGVASAYNLFRKWEGGGDGAIVKSRSRNE